jgi:hypothetical protein
MNFDAQIAFAAFYAIFWAALLAPMGKYSLYGIDGFGKGKEAALKNIARFLLGIVILNVLPAVWFAILFKCETVVSKTDTAPALIAAAIAAMSVFSFVNLGYAFFGAKPWVEYLHTKDELKDPKFKKVLEKVHSGQLAFLALIYIVVFPIFAILIFKYLPPDLWGLIRLV